MQCLYLEACNGWFFKRVLKGCIIPNGLQVSLFFAENAIVMLTGANYLLQSLFHFIK